MGNSAEGCGVSADSEDRGRDGGAGRTVPYTARTVIVLGLPEPTLYRNYNQNNNSNNNINNAFIKATMLELRFLLFVALYPGLSFSSVPAPTNISLTCHNFENTLYWNYSEPKLQPEYEIKIHGYESELKSVRTYQTYLNISEYTPDGENGYFITVEARVRGSELSESVENIRFSYNEDLDSDITCAVDFPDLKITILHHAVELLFDHPYDFYNVSSLSDRFTYTVFYNETEREFFCDLEDEGCTAELHLSESLYGKCMNVHIRGHVNSIPIKTSRDVCSFTAPDNDWTMISTVLLCSLVGLLVLITLVVLLYKKLTQPDSQIISKFLGMMNSDRSVHILEQPDLCEVMSVGQAPLLETPNQAVLDSPSITSNSQFPTHVSVFTDVQDSGEVTEDTNSGGCNSGNSVNSVNSGTSYSGYDRQKFPVHMGLGDTVKGYGR